MGGSATTRFLLLLTATATPSSLLPRCYPSLLRRLSPFRLSFHPSPVRLISSSSSSSSSSSQFQTLTSPSPSISSSSPPWPEWSHLLQSLSSAGYFNSQLQYPLSDRLSLAPSFPDDFLRAASACFSFSRARSHILGMLPRRDIEVVVANGAPFLFKDCDEAVQRMQLFLAGNEQESEGEEVAVDLMKYLLSYVGGVVSSEGNNVHNAELLELSVRNLLREMCQLSYFDDNTQKDYSNGTNGNELYQSGLVQNLAKTEGYESTTRSIGQNIEMKRGDWICPRCRFMNFARNVKCLECEDPRPKKQLTGREWECPQCDFLNFGRNIACLRCDCKRPGAALHGVTNSGSGFGYGDGNNLCKDDADGRLAANEEKAQRWFSKLSQRDSSSMGVNSDIADEDFPEIIPLRKGVNRFVVSPRKTGHLGVDESENVEPDKTMSFASGAVRESGSVAESDEYGKSGENWQTPTKFIGQSNSTEKVQAEKSDWLKRLTELHNVTYTSGAPDEGFPDIMPMRKGENQFVVNKKKDRSLTSPMYKRRVAMEQANNTNYVPFVPFPPGYFAKKDDQQLDTKLTGETTISETLGKVADTKPSVSHSPNVPVMENQLSGTGSWNSRPFGQDVNGIPTDAAHEPRSGNSTQKVVDPQPSGSNCWRGQYSSFDTTSETLKPAGHSQQNLSGPQRGGPDSGSSGYSWKQNSNNTGNFASPQPSVKPNWTGKSLEGSQVKEPDPLDMSEEAKAERWFRRVAQIKDISELSQIPDEDFPSIMPMRKGVNRFVVSKRKTPLERRLTSTQYRRNLPVVSSDPLKENDSS